jgi:hypothetical protein
MAKKKKGKYPIFENTKMMQIFQMNNQMPDTLYVKNQEPIYIKRSRKHS